jgi:hypothetical protein
MTEQSPRSQEEEVISLSKQKERKLKEFREYLVDK